MLDLLPVQISHRSSHSNAMTTAGQKSLAGGMNMKNTSSQIASEGNSGHVLDRKSQKIAELEKLVKRMSNALVSLEEDNLNLNRKLKERHALSCPDLGLATTAASQSPPTQDTAYLDRCCRLEAEKLQEANLRRVEESKNKELEAELKALSRANADVSKSLERRNRRLVKENEVLIEQAQLCRNDLRSGEAGEPDLEKRKLAEEVVQLRSEVTRLTEELRKGRPPTAEDGGPGEGVGGRGPDTAALLRRENRTLRESLEKSRLALREVEGARVEREELERCLVTLRMEKDLLREEVRKLHREYVSLVDAVASQLRDSTPGKGILVLELETEQKKSGGKELLAEQRSPGTSGYHSPPQRATVDKPLGGAMTEQIRLRFEDVQKRNISASD